MEIAAELQLPANPNRQLVLVVINIAFLKPDVALVDTAYGPSPDNVTNGRAFYVFVKRNDQWLIRAARVTRLVEPAVVPQ
jgi:hypothetical protein